MNNKIKIRQEAILKAVGELSPCNRTLVLFKVSCGRRQGYSMIKSLIQEGMIVCINELLFLTEKAKRSLEGTYNVHGCVLLNEQSLPLETQEAVLESVAGKMHTKRHIYTISNNNISNNIYSKYIYKEKKTKMKKEKDTKQKSETHPDYLKFMKVYYDFVQSKNGVPPKITAADGKALKDIISYLISICDNDSDRALNGWKAIFDRWYLLDNYTKDRIRLIDINSQMNNIISQIKAGGVKKGSASVYDSIDAKIKSE